MKPIKTNFFGRKKFIKCFKILYKTELFFNSQIILKPNFRPFLYEDVDKKFLISKGCIINSFKFINTKLRTNMVLKIDNKR